MSSRRLACMSFFLICLQFLAAAANKPAALSKEPPRKMLLAYPEVPAAAPSFSLPPPPPPQNQNQNQSMANEIGHFQPPVVASPKIPTAENQNQDQLSLTQLLLLIITLISPFVITFICQKCCCLNAEPEQQLQPATQNNYGININTFNNWGSQATV